MIIFRYCEQWKMPVIIRDQCSSHSDNRVCSEIMNFIFKNKKSALFPSCLSDYTLMTIQVLVWQTLQRLLDYKIFMILRTLKTWILMTILFEQLLQQMTGMLHSSNQISMRYLWITHHHQPVLWSVKMVTKWWRLECHDKNSWQSAKSFKLHSKCVKYS